MVSSSVLKISQFEWIHRWLAVFIMLEIIDGFYLILLVININNCFYHTIIIARLFKSSDHSFNLMTIFSVK